MTPSEALDWIFVAAMAALIVFACVCFYKFARS